MSDTPTQTPTQDLPQFVKLKFSFIDIVKEVSFPNVGQLIDIANAKIRISNGNYKDYSTTASDLYTRGLVEAIATFSVLLPELKDNIIGSFQQADPSHR